ncbi:MAG TPA: tRNA (adenosine(37)-N6)-threonylcarbamoyltransferase complex transferase subunit TsaD [Actinomycetota bacterium]|nr:tRNA (adenosine(37)-N6)-threonylcarbamoyltransferase complex transferase subunit TsaD [Actinomycetota bacterium]
MTGSAVAEDALILGIETSCDETAVAVVRGGRRVLSNVIDSQARLHERFGGVVPEIAARAHDARLPQVIDQALREAGVKMAEVSAVAATRGPGLIGALIVGFSAGKAMASALGVPFSGVHHLEGHVLAVRLEDPATEPPYVALVVSGGHTALYSVQEEGVYQTLGSTLDDAAGEAFDKVARFLDLGYPGGPAIDRLAKRGDPQAVAFPRGLTGKGLDFSFSGVKTAVVRHVHRAQAAGEKVVKADIAASFQEAVVDVQVEKAMRALEMQGASTLVVGGGVAANTRLRARLAEEASRRGARLVIPDRKLCVDNGAMIAAAGFFRLSRGEVTPAEAPADPSLKLPSAVA